MKYLIAVLMLAISQPTLAAKNTPKDGIEMCIVQGEFANTVQKLRQQHTTLTLSIAKAIVDNEMGGTEVQRTMFKHTLEFMWGMDRRLHPNNVQDTVTATCLKGVYEAIQGEK